MKIVGMMRVKNEARWIAEVLAGLRQICSETIVMDDHSTDDTAAICRSMGAHVLDSPFDDLNEGRDKTYLLEEIRFRFGPDWIVQVDGDEILEPGSGPELLSLIESGSCDMIRFPVVYLWDRRDQMRVDGIYGRFKRGSAFRVQVGQGFAAGFHCSNVPGLGWRPRQGETTKRLLHLGYLHREDRIRKYIWYNAKDPNNRLEDRYRHMVAGDPFPPEVPADLWPEVPATAKTKHAGPLTLVPLG